MTTRSKSDILKFEVPFMGVVTDSVEPTTMQEALQCQEWSSTMEQEFDALTQNKT